MLINRYAYILMHTYSFFIYTRLQIKPPQKSPAAHKLHQITPAGNTLPSSRFLSPCVSPVSRHFCYSSFERARDIADMKESISPGDRL